MLSQTYSSKARTGRAFPARTTRSVCASYPAPDTRATGHIPDHRPLMDIKPGTSGRDHLHCFFLALIKRAGNRCAGCNNVSTRALPLGWQPFSLLDAPGSAFRLARSSTDMIDLCFPTSPYSIPFSCFFLSHRDMTLFVRITPLGLINEVRPSPDATLATVFHDGDQLTLQMGCSRWNTW